MIEPPPIIIGEHETRTPEEVFAARKHPYAQCEDCPMNGRRFKAAPSFGPLDARIAVVAEMPGIDEICARPPQPLIGPSGKLIRGVLQEHAKLDPRTDVYYTNAVLCMPPNGDMKPYTGAFDNCRTRLLHDLSQLTDVETIIAAGGPPAESVLKLVMPSRRKKVAITNERGLIVQPEPGAPLQKQVLLTVNPAFIFRAPEIYSAFTHDIERAVGLNQLQHRLQIQPPYTVVQDALDIDLALQNLSDGDWISVDIEAEGLNWYSGPNLRADDILLIGIGTKDHSYIIPESLVFDKEVQDAVNYHFKRLRQVYHNGKYDCLFLHRDGYSAAHVHSDTMLAHFTLAEADKHGLKVLGASYYGIPNYEDEYISKYLPNKKASWRAIPTDMLTAYLAWDLALTLQLREDFETMLEAEKQTIWPFQELVIPASDMLLAAEKQGMQVDEEYLAAARGVLEEAIAKSLADLRRDTYKPAFNPNSPQQFGAVLFDDLGFRPTESKHFPKRSTSAGALKQIGPLCQNHPIVLRVMEHRRMRKMLTTYVLPLGNWLDYNNRVHPSYKIHGARTGRLSAEKPPIQTLPRPGKDRWGDMIRASIIAAPGNVLVMGDYNQAEMRVWAVFSQDPFLLECYLTGRDLHNEGALRLFGPNYTTEQRTWVKNFNFAYIYGGNEYSFAGQYNLPIEQARAFVAEYEAMMPVAREWRARIFAEALENKFVVTPFGRKRRFPLIRPETLDDIRKASWNAPIQSTASDLNLLASIEMHRRGWKVVLSMHDATGIECAIADAERCERELDEVMMGIALKWIPDIPWKVDIKSDYCWAPKVNKQDVIDVYLAHDDDDADDESLLLDIPPRKVVA